MTLFSPRGMMIGFRGHTSTQGFEQVLQNRDMTSEVAASQATGLVRSLRAQDGLSYDQQSTQGGAPQVLLVCSKSIGTI